MAIVFLTISLFARGSESAYQPEPISFAQFQELVALSSGNILVVDLWATWCIPCRERFPIIHDLEINYSEQDIEFITLSFDDPRDPESLARATRFLENQNANYRHFIMKDPMTLAFHYLELEVLPAVLVYDQSRQKLIRILASVPTKQLHARVAQVIDQWLLAEKDSE